MPWKYPPELHEALGAFGLCPAPASPPLFVRDALNDLYRYELRQLRERYMRHEFAKADYHQHVIGLRKKYWPLTMLPHVWMRVCVEVVVD